MCMYKGKGWEVLFFHEKFSPPSCFSFLQYLHGGTSDKNNENPLAWGALRRLPGSRYHLLYRRLQVFSHILHVQVRTDGVEGSKARNGERMKVAGMKRRTSVSVCHKQKEVLSWITSINHVTSWQKLHTYTCSPCFRTFLRHNRFAKVF